MTQIFSLYFSVIEGNDLSLDIKTKFRLSVLSDGVISWAPGFKWITSCPVDLTYFPYDTQTCHVQFINWVYQHPVIQFEKGKDEVDLNLYQTSSEWELLETKMDDSPIIFEATDITNNVTVNATLPLVQFSVTLKRMPSYFVNTVIVPCVIVTIMTAMVFFLPSESGEKVSFGTTLLLSYTVLILMVSDITPRTGTAQPLLGEYHSTKPVKYYYTVIMVSDIMPRTGTSQPLLYELQFISTYILCLLSPLCQVLKV